MLGRPYLRADNRAVLTALNDSLLREFLKSLSHLKLSLADDTAAVTNDSMVSSGVSVASVNVSMVSNDSSMMALSRMLTSFTYEMSYLLSRHRGDNSDVDKLCDKLFSSLPDVAHVCRRLLLSDNVSWWAVTVPMSCIIGRICSFSVSSSKRGCPVYFKAWTNVNGTV